MSRLYLDLVDCKKMGNWSCSDKNSVHVKKHTHTQNEMLKMTGPKRISLCTAEVLIHYFFYFHKQNINDTNKEGFYFALQKCYLIFKSKIINSSKDPYFSFLNNKCYNYSDLVCLVKDSTDDNLIFFLSFLI